VAEIDHEIVDGVRQFVQRHIEGRSQALEESSDYPAHVIAALSEMGLFSMAVPREYGGLQLSVGTYARVMEELAYGWTTLPCFLNSHFSAASILSKHGTEEQKAKYLPRMATGEIRVAIALTEPSGGSDLQAIRTTATRVDDSTYRIRGGKIFITNGERSSVCLVLARTSAGKDGISIFILEKGLEGFKVGSRARTMGHKHVDVAELIFDDVHVTSAELVGGVEGRGLSQMLDALETGRIAMAAAAVGLSRSAVKTALDYSKDRETFGKPISQHQAIQMLLAEMSAKTMAARSLTLEAAKSKDAGVRSDMIAGMAKMFAGEVCAAVSLDCIRVLGGSGFVSDFPAERYYREAPYYIVTEGTNEIQKLVIARRLIAGDGAAIGLF
jgi:alkylation response protein AidB-like acyl-CoA dehydrogenase